MARIIQNADIESNSQFSPQDTEWIYNALDCTVTMEIFEELHAQCDPIAMNTYNFSRALQAPVMEMSIRGLLVDQRRRAEVLAKYRGQMVQLSEHLNTIVRDGVGLPSFNWNSPSQVQALLYDTMKIPPVTKRNSNGRMVPTSNREALEKLAQRYIIAEPICNIMLALRDLEKKRQLLETEIDRDGRFRTSLNIAGTSTGRLASSISDFGTGGNLQNIDRDLRSVFISDPGWKFANLDLEQGDSRNVGAICWDLFLESHGEGFAGSYLNACESGDLHTYVATLAYPELAWTYDRKANRAIADEIFYRNLSRRDLSKKLGHGSNYEGQPATMAKHAHIPKQAAETFQRNYFGGFPCLPEWHKWVHAQLVDPGHITTHFGRRRYFFGRAEDGSTRREAVAYEPQSMTADEIDTGILNVWRANRVQLLIQVHDSILVQYREEEEAEVLPWLLETLKTRLVLKGGREFCVPTEAKVGWNWGDVVYWSKDDYKKGLCSAEQVGTVHSNEDGLVKWRSQDTRVRAESQSRLSLLSRAGSLRRG